MPVRTVSSAGRRSTTSLPASSSPATSTASRSQVLFRATPCSSRREIDHIAPGVELARDVDGIEVTGPFPSDTLFIKARDGEFDGVVTMYHDQGQIALKLMGFDQGVTVQGGLPVPIATPEIGRAHEIGGMNKAHLGPSQRAFDG